MKLRTFLCAVAMACALLALAVPAAKADCDNDGKCGPATAQRDTSRARASFDRGTVIGRRPPGCPRKFCGCEASLYVFGKIRPELNLAANWKRLFPRTAPAPGMAAARNGHVMVLMSHVAGDQWLVHDGNSGGGKTRRHVRSIRGFVVVDPHGAKVASR
jgi:hypothetical protein